MDFLTATKLMQNLLEAKSKNEEKLLLPVLARKAESCLLAYPEDITSREMARFLNKRASKNDLTISKQDLKTAYQTFYSANNKFQEAFGEELDIEKKPEDPHAHYPKLMDRYKEYEDRLKDAAAKNGNDVLQNYFASKLSKNEPVKRYTKQAETQASTACALKLAEFGLSPKSVKTIGGDENFLICQATYETPKGTTNFALPVEVVQNKILLPGIFISANGPQDFEQNKIKQEILSCAGKSFTISLDKLLPVLKQAKFGIEEDDEVEKALAKKAMKETTYFDQNGIVFQTPINSRGPVEMPKIEMPEKISSIIDNLTSKAGLAELKFGSANVNKSRNFIQTKLADCGFKNAQIGILDSNDHEITYSVALSSNQAFRIPVKMSKSSFVLPEVIVSNGSVHDFSTEGISEAMQNAKLDSRALTTASPMYDLQPEELLKRVKSSLEEGKLKVAEEALYLLQNTNHKKLYNEGYNLFIAALKNSSSLEKHASVKKSTCSRPIKVASSQHLICSHTNLPIHKVYQDNMGSCRPLYRQNMKEDYDGATFMNYQAFWGKEI